MSKILKSKSKPSRRYGASLWGRPNDAYEKRPQRPGQHKSVRRSSSDYGKQLVRKQKVKNYYAISEKVLRKACSNATASLKNSAEHLLGFLESFAFVAVYRAGFAPTIFSARQMVGHGHFMINGKRFDVPTLRLRPGDTLQIRPKSKDVPSVAFSSAAINVTPPEYLEVDSGKLSVTMRALPKSVAEVPYESQMNLLSVIEYYTR